MEAPRPIRSTDCPRRFKIREEHSGTYPRTYAPWLHIILNDANGRVVQLLRVLRLTSRIDMEIGIKRAWKCIYHLSI